MTADAPEIRMDVAAGYGLSFCSSSAADAAATTTDVEIMDAEPVFQAVTEATAAVGLSGFFCFPASAAADVVTTMDVDAAADKAFPSKKLQAPAGACFSGFPSGLFIHIPLCRYIRY